MNLLVIGDVHGCYHTLKQLVEEHWDVENELLIQLGDMVNKGSHSIECIKYWQQLQAEHGDYVVMLRGNHEQQFVKDNLEHPRDLENALLQRDALAQGMKVKSLRKWFTHLPLGWENDDILVTHAGVAKNGINPFSAENKTGVLYNKGPLKCLKKLQVKGHSIVAGDKPVFVPRENAWYIDTGAWTKKYLSAIRLSPKGEMLKAVRVKIHPEDKRK
ncbi:metallophosphoesterase family protein [Owenweeksia hongkongensis]|uniref:metallophosphoesterase family protein n=1 Tax=Owenweeksia hongkongensis TaxID=253245 RepID=UPI003A9240EA